MPSLTAATSLFIGATAVRAMMVAEWWQPFTLTLYSDFNFLADVVSECAFNCNTGS